MGKYLLKLYITGQTSRSQRAISNLRRIYETIFPNEKYELIIIDLLERPQMAEEAKILATPTLVKELPPPIRRIVGDLSDVNKVLEALDLQPYLES